MQSFLTSILHICNLKSALFLSLSSNIKLSIVFSYASLILRSLHRTRSIGYILHAKLLLAAGCWFRLILLGELNLLESKILNQITRNISCCVLILNSKFTLEKLDVWFNFDKRCYFSEIFFPSFFLPKIDLICLTFFPNLESFRKNFFD